MITRTPSIARLFCLGITLAAGCTGLPQDGDRGPDDPGAVETVPQALTVSVRPVADVEAIGVVSQSGGTTNLYRNVDDGTSFTSADDDTTYVRNSSNFGTHRVRYAPGSSGTVTKVVLRYRARRSNAGGFIQVHLFDGNELVASGPERTPGTSYTNFTETFSNLKISSLANLRTEVNLLRTSGTGNIRYTLSWVTADVFETCVDAVAGNDLADPSRFNLVFVGAGFADDDRFAAAVRRIVDVDGSARGQVGADGLMQIPAFGENRHRFNFLYVSGTKPYAQATPTPDEVSAALFRFERVLTCQDVLPNRVIPMFVHRGVANGVGDYPYGSFGRRYVMIADCDGQASCWNGLSPLRIQQSDVHEMLHTISCLPDEYGWNGETGPDPVPFTGPLTANATLQFWQGDSYSACLASAPWRSQIGNGCGQPGVIDCFKPECVNTSVQPPQFNIPFRWHVDMREDCCLPGRDCIAEVACFRGGMAADTGIFRSTAGSLLRNVEYPPFTPATYAPPVVSDLIRRGITKGPAVGKRWHAPPYASEDEYGLDCDVTRSGFYQ